jgi:flagellar export protein FliJ
MKQFRFTLRSILKLREDREEEAERHYGRMLHSLEVAKQQVAQAKNELEACWLGTLSATTAGCQVWQLDHNRLYANDLRQKIARLEIRRNEAAAASQAALRALQVARQKREILEKLRDRRKQEHLTATAHSLQNQLDDRVSATFGRPTALTHQASSYP